MKRIIRALAARNRRLEQLLHLAIWARRSVRSRGMRGTGSYLWSRWQLRSDVRHVHLPEGYPLDQIPTPAQANQQVHWAAGPGYRPRFGLALPVSEASSTALFETVLSVLAQSYPHWTLTLLVADQCNPELTKAIRFLSQRDPRIRVSPGVGSIALRINQTLAATEADFVGVVPQGDRLTLDALFQLAHCLEQGPHWDVLYSDEVHVKPRLNEASALILKPDWSPEQLLSYDYISNSCIIRRTIWEQQGGYREECDASRDWDLHLRLAESGTRFHRVPKCLYLRNSKNGPRPIGAPTLETTAEFELVLREALARRGMSASVEPLPNGTHRLNWNPASPPSVSVILRKNKASDRVEALATRLLEKTDYPRCEVIILDGTGNSELLQTSNNDAPLRFLRVPENTSIAAAWNLGAKSAKGECLVFLDAQADVASSDWLNELVGWAELEDVGIVSPQTLPRKKIEHPTLKSLLESPIPSANEDWELFGTACYRNSLAADRHCQLIPRRIFDELGGFDERYQGDLAIAAFGLKVWSKGYRIVSTPFAKISLPARSHSDASEPLEDEELLAQDARKMGVRQSPYSHPVLSAHSGRPNLRMIAEMPADQIADRLINHFDPPAELFTRMHWFDDRRFLEQANDLRVQLPLPTYAPGDVANTEHAASRFVLFVLRARDDLRERFPLALSEGEAGGFCRWLCEEGLSQYRIPNPEDAAKNIRGVFRNNPGARIRQLLAYRSDITQKFPTALLPLGEGWLLRWMLAFGRAEHRLLDEEIWWFMLEAGEDPVRELEWTYQISPDWQRSFPAGLTPFGCEKLLQTAERRYGLPAAILDAARERWSQVTFDGLKLAYAHHADWQTRFPQAFRRPQDTQRLLAWLGTKESAQEISTIPLDLAAKADSPLGLNVLGHFCYPSGLQQSTKFIVRSLKQLGVPVSCRDVPAHFDVDDTDRSGYLDFETHDVSLIHVQPLPDVQMPYEEISFKRAGLAARSDVYRIGMWYWELEDIPSTWQQASQTVDELWAPTAFIGDAIRKTLPIKVTNTLPGVQLGEIEPVSRESLGVADDEFLFLFMFDMKSFMERKNPLGLIEAYEKAFHKDDKAKLIIKVSSGHFNPAELARLKSAADRAGVEIIDQVLPRAQAYGLVQACDAYVSLHRSEGLGLTMAEAMLMAKPVIATNYSGNVDFMDPSCSCLVDYELRRLEGTCPDYVYAVYSPDSAWANPSAEHAAHWMRWAFEHQDEARQMGQNAQRHAREILSLEAAGLRMKTRLEEIYAEREGNRSVKKAA